MEATETRINVIVSGIEHTALHAVETRFRNAQIEYDFTLVVKKVVLAVCRSTATNVESLLTFDTGTNQYTDAQKILVGYLKNLLPKHPLGDYRHIFNNTDKLPKLNSYNVAQVIEEHDKWVTMFPGSLENDAERAKITEYRKKYDNTVKIYNKISI